VSTIVYLLISLCNVYSMIIFVYVLMSWFPMNNKIVVDVYEFLGKICDPYLNLFRKFIPPIGGTVDISPIVALLVLQFGVRLIVGIF
jgi:YggT family protein